ncbi:MAG: hypothetical protein OXG92_10840 [Chloroflexi bacterium]|nr:hypothetical protein [Chloroflexota bacterium]MCY3583668.1 hypothetical protein [Chloroflexota bacterium]MCY3716948.1 hypothetical protein [Chloroflexota bacterium]MDE2650132.1 hypothetical protein [Chloroflexota bacterium]MXX49580.1 hypothetical protein [Chloroflexota bacterium]
MTENTLTLISFALTMMVFSYLLGDLPLIRHLYRIAVYIFIGMSAAFTLIVGYENLLLPYWQDAQNPAISWTALGSQADIVVFGTALLFTALLLLKPVTRLGWLTNSILAVVVALGAAVGIVGALRGTLLPLLSATASLPVLDAELGALLESLLVLLGTMTALYSFHYQASSSGEGTSFGLGKAFRSIGKACVVVALGAIYAAAILSSMTILTERIAFLFQFGA